MRNLLLVSATLLSFGMVSAQTQKPSEPDLQVQLTSTIKAKKAKVADAISALTVTSVTLSGGLAIPAGSKVTGHVRQVEADSTDAHTSLIALSFDEIALKNGTKVPLNCFVRAALLPGGNGTTTSAQNSTMVTPNRGQLNGGMGGALPIGKTGGMVAGTAVASGDPDSATSSTQSSPAQPVAAHKGQVIGMSGVELKITNPDHLSVFISAHKNLELAEGMQLMLDVMQ